MIVRRHMAVAEHATRRGHTLVGMMAAACIVFALCVQTACWMRPVGKFFASQFDCSALQINLAGRNNTETMVTTRCNAVAGQCHKLRDRSKQAIYKHDHSRLSTNKLTSLAAAVQPVLSALAMHIARLFLKRGLIKVMLPCPT